jgi:ADP-L-glycero-D-manno-heptose 6-epimerase
MNILVTGGTGFIGSNLTNRLLELGHKVSITGFQQENSLEKDIRLIGSELDKINDKNLKGYDICFHQAANNNTLEQNGKKVFQQNVQNPISLFEKLYKYGCRKFIYASSTAVYGNRQTPYTEDTRPEPLNVYAQSKLAFDEFADKFKEKKSVSIIGLRYCNIYGPKEEHKGSRASMIYHICKDVMLNRNPRVFKYGEQKRDWCYVKDVVEANIKCMYYENSNIFNIAGGKSISFNDLYSIIKSALGSESFLEYIDCDFVDRYQNDTECDISKAKKELRWKPCFDIKSGIQDYISHLLQSTFF